MSHLYVAFFARQSLSKRVAGAARRSLLIEEHPVIVNSHETRLAGQAPVSVETRPKKQRPEILLGPKLRVGFADRELSGFG